RLNALVRDLFSFGIHSEFNTDVTLLRWVDAIEVSDPFAMFGVFADSDVDISVIVSRCPDDVVSCRTTSEHIDRFFWIRIKLPQKFRSALTITCGVDTVDPTVAAAHHDLLHSADFKDAGAGPLSMQNIQARRLISPEKFSIVLVETDKARRIRCGDRQMSFVD